MANHQCVMRCGMLLLPFIACGNVNPDEQRDTGGAFGTDSQVGETADGGSTEEVSSDEVPLSEDYYPLALNLMWQYEETINGEVIGSNTYTVTDKIVRSFDFVEGPREVFAVQNSRTYNLESTIQYIENTKEYATRLMHQVYDDGVFTKQRDFVPGFLRFHRTKMVMPGEVFTEQVARYQDTDPEDDIPATGPEQVTYRYTVSGVGVGAQVKGATYPDCVRILRESTIEGWTETKEYWFAKGIGKVKEVTVNTVDGEKTEELIACTLCQF